MNISGYTYVRNGLNYSYPFIQAIQSALPFVDEFIVVLGDSTDGSREAIVNIGSPKVKIVDTIWNMNLRVGGKLFAQQSNIGLAAATGDWILHLQADEVIHENDVDNLKKYIVDFDKDPKVEGLLFPFLNFRGDYDHVVTGRSRHRFEIRAFRRNPLIFSYRDSQGFRKFSSPEAYENGEEKGVKLKVARIDTPIYHYSHVRPPKTMQEKAKFFNQFYHDDKTIEKQFAGVEEYDYNQVDRLTLFKGTHPAIMAEQIKSKDWEFRYDPKKRKIKWRHEILNRIEELTGWRIGEYKNYVVVRDVN